MKTIKISSYAQYIADSKFFIKEIKQSNPTNKYISD